MGDVVDVTGRLPRSATPSRPEASGKHVAICASCGVRWPCAHFERDREVRRAIWYREHACGHCGKTVDNGQIGGKVNGRWFHLRRRSACLRAARVAAELAGEPDPRPERAA